MDKMPVFIKIDKYEDVLDLMNIVRDKVEKAKEVLVKIDDLKRKEDEKINQWRSNILDIENKLNNLNNSLFEPDN
ncbi:hypothetical protein KY334_00545 [Candidatus Woesearchaeota archaeon]|nr:hypothetical protein [Candidatus Woesearchaeota archaeon]